MAAVVTNLQWDAVPGNVCDLLGRDYEAVKNSVRNHNATAWEFKTETALISWIEWTDARELVVCAAAGHGIGEWVVYLTDRVRKSEFHKSIRFHTLRPGLRRLVESAGYRLEPEYVYRWNK